MGFFCKKSGPFLNTGHRVHYVQYQYFFFYILLIWGGGCVRTQRTPPPLPTGLFIRHRNQKSETDICD